MTEEPIEMVIDRNLRKDGIIKPLNRWDYDDLSVLYRAVQAEIRNRKEERQFWKKEA